MKRKVFVGFSGGVDSTLTAKLLKDNYNVTTVMFRNISNPEYTQPVEQNAKKVSKYLDIPFKIVDFTKEFKDLIIDPFIETPNPCVLCNIQFKFNKFANWCLENGADLIATGHYCQTKDGHLYKGNDIKKDQSYFLNGVSSNILEKTLFPIGNLTKDKVRELAKKFGLPNMSQKDSQEVCFIDTDLNRYLSKFIIPKVGDIIDIDSKEVVGKHIGIHSLTLGQRRGIKIGGSSKPYFVADKDIKENIIYVAKGKLNPVLWKDSFTLKDLNIIHPDNQNLEEGLTAMVRYRSKEVSCNVDWDSKTVTLNQRVWTPSNGQSLVLYKESECIGGGIISDIS